MKWLSANQIRRTWIDFFESKQHHFLQTVSLVPVDDPTLLWINSGVATLKPYFDGRKTPPLPRLTNSQKAIRTNDIENVGVTARHQTMFEMLGNFSIGEYFKKEAIEFAWELLTSPVWFGIPANKLYITVFEEDQEAYDIWANHIQIPIERIFKMGRDTNFWDVGNGPCGPNTEIFFDRGTKWDKANIGPKLLFEDIENDRYIEIWNIVFSQFNNNGDGTYTELPRKNIDTGAGLERLASVFQDTPTNFETDLFLSTIKTVETMTSDEFKYSLDDYENPVETQTKINTAFKVIADHVRATSFAIADGVLPGNKDRGYIIRRLIRRSSIYGRKLGIEKAFLHKLVDCVVEAMCEFYPYLKDKRDLIISAIRDEENKFLKTLSRGYEMLNKIIDEQKLVSGKNALLLFESYGFPIEETLELANEKNVKVDLDEFSILFEATKEKARNSRKDMLAWDRQSEILTNIDVQSEFIGWYGTKQNNAKVIYMFANDKEIQSATDQEVYLILDKTVFYAEKGGQAADIGIIKNSEATIEVLDVQAGPHEQNIHLVHVNGTINVGDIVECYVDEEKRTYTMKNHSGTHMIHYVLRHILGDTVMQSGSYNDQHGLRMDFTFNRNITNEEIKAAENEVLKRIKEGHDCQVYFCSLDEAINKHHALAFFTEKYHDEVRVVKFGDFSSELCGGTHVDNTKDIQDFIITGIESKGSGLFRLKAFTSHRGVENYLNLEMTKFKSEVERLFKRYQEFKIIKDIEFESLVDKIMKLAINRDNLELIENQVQLAKNAFKTISKKAEELIIQEKISSYIQTQPVFNSEKQINEIVLDTNNMDIVSLKTLADQLRNMHDDLLVILQNKDDNAKFVVVGINESIADKYSAIEIFKELPIKPKGGGNKTFAQGKY